MQRTCVMLGGWADGRADARTRGPTDGRTDGRTDGWTGGRAGGPASGRELVQVQWATWLSMRRMAKWLCHNLRVQLSLLRWVVIGAALLTAQRLGLLRHAKQKLCNNTLSWIGTSFPFSAISFQNHRVEDACVIHQWSFIVAQIRFVHQSTWGKLIQTQLAASAEAKHTKHRWTQQEQLWHNVKTDNKTAMTIHNDTQQLYYNTTIHNDTWQDVTPRVEFQHARVRASFFRNGGHKFAAKLSTAAWLRREKIRDLSTIRSVWARWPWTLRRCADLDSWQAELIRWTMKLLKEDDETDGEFVIRRNRRVKEVAKAQGLWSLSYTKAVSEWYHVNAWHGNLMETLSPTYLQTLRKLSANNRTHTRRVPGGFLVRWCESIARANAFLKNLPKVPSSTKNTRRPWTANELVQISVNV